MADTGRVLQPWWHPTPLAADEPFFPITNPHDVLYINGFALPGITEVKPGRGHSLHVKQSAGKHYATVTDQGYKPCDVIITNRIWTPLHWQIWQLNILPILEPDPSGKYELPTVQVSHPDLYVRRIDAITIEHILGPIRHGDFRVFEIKAMDFNQSNKNATNTPKGAGLKQFSNALTGKNQKPSTSPIPVPHH